MKIPLTLWAATFFILTWIHIMSCMNSHSVSSLCLDDQKSLLLQLRKSLKFDRSISTKLDWWNHTSTDCCQWSGVECDHSTGNVIGLDLSYEGINNEIDNSSSLFGLRFLGSLNLAYNDDITGQIPSAIGKLTSLTYLNLSSTSFSGQVPIEISYLLNLLILDISMSYPRLTIKNPNLAMILKNLTNIRELYLDKVDISANGSEWCEAISSSLPHLQVLSMSDCYLTGEIHHSLAKLHSLSVIRLDGNNLSCPVPEFLAGFKNLTSLSLGGSQLLGAVPDNIFHVPTLKFLDLSENDELQGTLPNFVEGGVSLQTLLLRNTDFSGMLPQSIGNLKRLQSIDLQGCQFHGIIPPSMGSLNLLEYVDLSNNYFSGPILSFSSAKKLTRLDISKNSLSGSITNTDWGGLLDLQSIALSSNSLSGRIPTILFSLPSLQDINLEQNKFSGQLNEFSGSLMLRYLDLSNNNLEGPIPKSVFELGGLVSLDLSWNKFNGTLELNDILHSLINLTHLSLSHNSLSIDTNGPPSANSRFAYLSELGLASCNLRILPESLKNQSSLFDLDLSNNQIQGMVPTWIWEAHNLFSLDLSSNNFVGVEQPLQDVSADTFLHILDLHSNNLEGKLPTIPLPFLTYLDFSNNSFTSIDTKIDYYLPALHSLILSRNKIHGTIPSSLCKVTPLIVLDLEYNNLNGTIPHCLISMSQTLRVLNLQGNNLQGAIPDEFGKDCMLASFNVNKNLLHGTIPRSLANCQHLNALDLGKNGLNDTFPCHLESLSSLQVLVLRSNKFHGTVVCSDTNPSWPLLQILDLASNNFNGQLSTLFFGKWGKMMTKSNETQSELTYLEGPQEGSGDYGEYYEEVAITFKGTEFTLPKILTIFTTIDLSKNNFDGEIPKEVWNMVGLKVLDLSHNSLSGSIPSSIRNLSKLESLNLCYNKLSGNIPQQLASLNFLEYLNLSFNKLTGPIPTGTQLQSFNASSYEGNPGLYGLPLTPSGRDRHAPDQLVPTTPSDGSSWSFKSELEWLIRGAEVGFPVGIIIFIGPLLYIKRWREQA